MVESKGSGAVAPKKKRKRLIPTYFFLEHPEHGPLLHRRLHLNRGTDTLTTWCYPLVKRVVYTFSDVKKQYDPAFTTVETGKMLNRGQLVLERAILRGDITRPQYTYGLDEHKRIYQYMWHEQNILEAHAYLSTIHKGRPRNDGKITPQKLPTARELRAMIRQEEMLYIRNESTGEFVPVWRAPDFD